jgi:benzoylformate decarboxylase
LLWADLPVVARPFVKWSEEVRRLSDLPRAIHRAAKTALAPPTGPVFLSLPGDILTDSADLDLGHPTRVAGGIRGDTGAIAEAAKLLARAKSPVIIAGDAVPQSNALGELVALAEALAAPVYDEGMATRAMFPSSHPLYRGALVRLPAAIRGLLDQHDLLVSIGADLFTLSLPDEVDAMPEGMDVIHLDTNPWELGKNYPARAAILGDPKTTLPEMTRALLDTRGQTDAAAVADRLTRARADGISGLARLNAEAEALAGRDPIHPLALMQAIGPRSFFGMRGGGIGWGLPAAIGAKLALPDRPVVALIGDGSAMYTIQGLWTAARENLRMVFVIINNYSYRILKQRTNAMKGLAAQADRYVGMDLDRPRIDFVSVARGLGLTAHRATKLSEVRDMLVAGLAHDGPTLIDVEVDRGWKPL